MDYEAIDNPLIPRSLLDLSLFSSLLCFCYLIRPFHLNFSSASGLLESSLLWLLVRSLQLSGRYMPIPVRLEKPHMSRRAGRVNYPLCLIPAACLLRSPQPPTALCCFFCEILCSKPCSCSLYCLLWWLQSSRGSLASHGARSPPAHSTPLPSKVRSGEHAAMQIVQGSQATVSFKVD